jgi:signal transduction histidine kinase
MRHIKIWGSGGRVLWSDEQVLIGQRFDLEPEVLKLFETGGAVGTLSTLDKDENVEEEDEGPLLEVYAETPSATGEPVIVESYWSTDRIDDDAGKVMARTVPLALGALMVFALLILPLARSLARRVERTRDENTALLRQSLAASDLERARVARDLHDGVMQDISGAGYALSAALGSMDQEPDQPRLLVEQVVALLHGVGESMRSTLADTYPADLARDGLPAAVQQLADRMSRSGVEVRADVSALEHERLEVVQLCFRVIREALRNVERHAQAQRAEVVAVKRGDTVQVSVDDDGVGLGEEPPREGHLGLTLLRETVTDVGGSMRVASGPHGGASVLVVLPTHLWGPR